MRGSWQSIGFAAGGHPRNGTGESSLRRSDSGSGLVTANPGAVPEDSHFPGSPVRPRGRPKTPPYPFQGVTKQEELVRPADPVSKAEVKNGDSEELESGTILNVSWLPK